MFCFLACPPTPCPALVTHFFVSFLFASFSRALSSFLFFFIYFYLKFFPLNILFFLRHNLMLICSCFSVFCIVLIIMKYIYFLFWILSRRFITSLLRFSILMSFCILFHFLMFLLSFAHLKMPVYLFCGLFFCCAFILHGDIILLCFLIRI